MFCLKGYMVPFGHYGRSSRYPCFQFVGVAANDHDFKFLYLKYLGDIRVLTEGFVVEVEFYDLTLYSTYVSTQASVVHIERGSSSLVSGNMVKVGSFNGFTTAFLLKTCLCQILKALLCPCDCKPVVGRGKKQKHINGLWRQQR